MRRPICGPRSSVRRMRRWRWRETQPHHPARPEAIRQQDKGKSNRGPEKALGDHGPPVSSRHRRDCTQRVGAFPGNPGRWQGGVEYRKTASAARVTPQKGTDRPTDTLVHFKWVFSGLLIMLMGFWWLLVVFILILIIFCYNSF